MTIEIPDWCKIGLFIEWHAPNITGNDWVKEEIIGYTYDGFFIKRIIAHYTKQNFQNMEKRLEK